MLRKTAQGRSRDVASGDARLVRAIYWNLIEHYAGEFPTWLAPVQAMVLNITDSQSAYVHEVTDALKAAGFALKTTRVTKKSGSKYASTRYRRFLTCW